MQYFFDTEFLEDGTTIMPISLGMVRQDGVELYFEFDFDEQKVQQHPWISKNVLPHLTWSRDQRLSRAQAAKTLLDFVGDDQRPEFWAYFADYDWVLLCQIFGTMMDLPSQFPKFCLDVQQLWHCLGQPNGVKPEDPHNLHNALADAKWTMEFFRRLTPE